MKSAFIVFFMFLSSVAFAQDRGLFPQPGNRGDQGEQGAQGTAGDPIRVEQGQRPVPDPTSLTAEAIRELRRELTTLYNQKFEDLQKQIDRLTLRLDREPIEMRESIAALADLTSEKFKGLVDQQVQRDNNLALALTAAQKSVTDQNASNLTAANKAEQNFKDQIAATQSTITDLKDRITRIESASTGAGGAVNWVIAGIGVIGAILGIIATMWALLKPSPVPVPLPVVQYSEQNGNGRRR